MKSTYIAILLCMSVSMIAHSGAVGGKKSGTGVAASKSSDIYTITYEKHKPAIFQMTGDNATDMDCLIYDSDKVLVVSDEDPGDVCLLSWVPAYTRKYTIVVRNNGYLENSYRYQTN